jgi:hypothetical protein
MFSSVHPPSVPTTGGATDDAVEAALRRFDISEHKVTSHHHAHDFALTDWQKRADKLYAKRHGGEKFPTIFLDATEGAPKWGGGDVVFVPPNHPSKACEAKAGARFVAVTKSGARYMWPESWSCNINDDSGSPEVRFERSIALVQMYHAYLHATNALKRKIVQDTLNNGVKKLFTARWVDDIGTRCLNALIQRSQRNTEDIFPADIASYVSPKLRASWIKVATAKTSGLVEIAAFIDAKGEIDTTGTSVPGGWLGCTALSGQFARLVIDAIMRSVFKYYNDWFASMDASLVEEPSEVVLMRQKVLLTLSQQMAETIREQDADATLLPALVAALKITNNAAFFPTAVTDDGTMTDENKKKAQEWQAKFSDKTKLAARINLQNEGKLGLAERVKKCDQDPALMLVGERDDPTSVCMPREFATVRKGLENKYAPTEEKALASSFLKYYQTVLAEQAKTLRSSASIIAKIHEPAKVLSGPLQEADEAVREISRRSVSPTSRHRPLTRRVSVDADASAKY